MQCIKIQIILYVEKKSKIMVLSSSNTYSKSNHDVREINTAEKTNLT